MGRDKMIRDDLRYLLFSELYLRFDSPKTKRKAFSILEATIDCIAKKGFDGLTMERIAREAGVTRQLVKYYFEDTRELSGFAIKYIRLLFQKLAVDAMLKDQRPDLMLANYAEVCFQWVDTFRIHALTWFCFLNLCSGNKKYRELNTASIMAGEERVRSLLEDGKKTGVFHVADTANAAKLIRILITGAMIVYASEELEDPKSFIRSISRQCLDLAGTESPRG